MKKDNILLNEEGGQSLVEFAFVLPLILMLILGMIEFGWILNGKITLTAAAREGARVAVIYESANEAAVAVQRAVDKSAQTSSLVDVITDTTFSLESAVIKVDAKIKPIVGLFFKSDIALNAKAEMRLE